MQSEREKEREKERERERERMSVCVCKRETDRQTDRDKQTDIQRGGKRGGAMETSKLGHLKTINYKLSKSGNPKMDPLLQEEFDPKLTLYDLIHSPTREIQPQTDFE